ncbi:hypothetical protein BC936DRAFT_148108 [Jimgerdemannia flammicorona]|uniref:Zinc finger PHD-type domain-containing protein n=1 Tax=Jimgerdemannia flammicorona TaxID=994334 RepID=A0A433D3Q2_9FUNG|nr:hypothetical protein BC936DRAFT_148108 [Jimgerdemannia flammicorona]
MDTVTTTKTYISDTPSPRPSSRSTSVSVTGATYSARTDHDRKDKTKLKKRSPSPPFAPRNSYVYDDEAEDDESDYITAPSLTVVEHERAYDRPRFSTEEADATGSEVDEDREETAASSSDGEDRAKESDRFEDGILEDLATEEEWGDEGTEQQKIKLDRIAEKAKRPQHKQRHHSTLDNPGPCYCGVDESSPLRPSITCAKCNRAFHPHCIRIASRFWNAILLGDDFFYFTCSTCNHGKEVLKRLNMSWIDVVHISLFNLAHTIEPSLSYPDNRRYYHWKQDLCAFIDTHWEQFWLKSRGGTWHNSVASCLSTNSPTGRFESGKMKYDKVGWWALTDAFLSPSSYESVASKRSRSTAYTVDEEGLLHEITSRSPAPPSKKRKLSAGVTQSTTIVTPDWATSSSAAGQNRSHAKVKRTRSEQLALGRSASPAGSVKGGMGGSGRDDDTKPLNLYPDIDNPLGPVVMSKAATHSASQFRVSDDGFTVWNEKVLMTCTPDISINPHLVLLPIHWSLPIRATALRKPLMALKLARGTTRSPLQRCKVPPTPVSASVKSRAIYRVPAGLTTLAMDIARILGRFSIGRWAGGSGTDLGDVLGLLIHLPPCTLEERAELNARRWDPTIPYKSYGRYHAAVPLGSDPYRLEEIGEQVFPVVKGSEVVIFRNDVKVGVAFEGLHLGKYYPAISSYMNCKLTVNFGAEPFKFAPKTWRGDSVRPIVELKRSDDIQPTPTLHINSNVDTAATDNVTRRSRSRDVSVDRGTGDDVGGLGCGLSRDVRDVRGEDVMEVVPEKDRERRIPLVTMDKRMDIDSYGDEEGGHFEKDSDIGDGGIDVRRFLT